ncbi:hypothetical protein L218DRAFT_1073462 [Marasmius fiardii PR-910]|nr:hypothetical protein L218DRAFT_1073462 [Marasmius fiardii PR-910]
MLEFVDDTNPQILKVGRWKSSSNPTFLNGTVHTTSGNASIHYDFFGTFIQIFGRSTNATSQTVQYTIDNVNPKARPEASAPSGVDGSLPNQVLFQSSNLSPGTWHSLDVRIEDAEFWLDYIIVMNPEAPLSLFSLTTNPTCPPNGTSTTSAPSNSSPTEQSNRVNVGGIVGGVIAALVVLATLTLIFLHWRRGQQRKESVRHSITPFHINPQTSMSQVPPTPDPLTFSPPAEGTLPPLAPLVAPAPSVTASSSAGAPSNTGATKAASTVAPSLLSPITIASSSGHPSNAGASHSLASPISDYIDDPPPPFAAISGTGVGRHPSMYKPRSMESLPPTEYGYGGGLMIREWSRPTGGQPPVQQRQTR